MELTVLEAVLILVLQVFAIAASLHLLARNAWPLALGLQVLQVVLAVLVWNANIT